MTPSRQPGRIAPGRKVERRVAWNRGWIHHTLGRKRDWYTSMNKASLLLALLMLAGLSSLSPTVQADEPVVRGMLFWAESCPHCHVVIAEILPPLQERYGSQLDIRTVELSDPSRYELWLAAIEALQTPPERAGVPMLLIGDSVLVGSGEISENLPGLIEEYLAAGGVDYPSIPGLETGLALTPVPPISPIPTSTPTVKVCHMCDEDEIPVDTPTPRPVVHVLFFSDRLCQECVVVQKEVLQPLQDKYGARLVIEQRDVEGSASNYNLLRALENQHGVVGGAMPAVFIGQEALNGEEAVRERLPGLIEKYLAQGGVSLPPVAPRETSTPPVIPPTPTADGPVLPIHLAYFHQPGCRECDRVQLDLNYLQQRYPQLVVHDFDVKAEAALAEWLGQRAGVPEGKRLTAPAVFVGGEALVGEKIHTDSLEALIVRHTATGAEAVWENRESQGEAAAGIIGRFRSFGALTVLAAGLVDGLNPCAFATVVFFISYLAFMGRRGREVLAAGAAFALGVFLTYLGVGVGVLRFLGSLPFLNTASRWINGLTAALCLILATGSLYDWWQARRGKPQEMRLHLPARLRRWINRAVREGAGMRAFVPVTFVTGVVISVIELACTGQVYLPTILFVLGVPELQVQAGVYLVLYNLAFILPLVVVFLLAYFGTTSQQLGLFIHRRAATIKLATAGLFVLLAGWLIVTLV